MGEGDKLLTSLRAQKSVSNDNAPPYMVGRRRTGRTGGLECALPGGYTATWRPWVAGDHRAEDYSYRRAIIGSTRMALRAGM
jgi:hypothetical protein